MTDAFLDGATFNVRTIVDFPHTLVMGEVLAEMARTREDIVVLTADLMLSNGTNRFQEAFPSRFFNLGIAEQNMMSVAAGLATCGLTPYVATFASFAALLCAEQIRTDLCYTRLPVRILSHHAGIAMGFYGTSHHATEDIAIIRAMAEMTIVAPCDAQAIRSILASTVDLPGPMYVRLGRGQEAQVYDTPPTFRPGKFHLLRDGADATIIATGMCVRAALDAAEVLATQGIGVRVLDAIYIKPLDTEAILAAARDTGAILVAEEHNPNGGLGGAVAEVLAESGVDVRFKRLALPDEFSLIAPPTHLYRHYGLTAEGVADAVTRLLLARQSRG